MKIILFTMISAIIGVSSVRADNLEKWYPGLSAACAAGNYVGEDCFHFYAMISSLQEYALSALHVDVTSRVYVSFKPIESQHGTLTVRGVRGVCKSDVLAANWYNLSCKKL